MIVDIKEHAVCDDAPDKFSKDKLINCSRSKSTRYCYVEKQRNHSKPKLFNYTNGPSS